MTPLFLTDVEGAVLGSRGADMRTPEFRPYRTAGAPARDPCGATAMVPGDLLGGGPLRGEVLADGARTDCPWWNRLGTGAETDLARERSGPGGDRHGGVAVPRPPEPVRLREQEGPPRTGITEKLGG